MANINLETSLQYLKGVGPKKLDYLKKLDLYIVKDLLFYFPRMWEDRRVLCKIKDIQEGERVTIVGKVVSTSVNRTKNGFVVFEALIKDDSGSLKVKWIRKFSKRYDVLFYLKKEIEEGGYAFLTGDMVRDGFSVIDQEALVPEVQSIHTNRIIPIYPASLKIDTKFLRSLTWQVLQYDYDDVVDFLPLEIRLRNNLPDLKTALQDIHFPCDWKRKQAAYFRLSFDEFFLLELILMKEYQNIKKIKKSHFYELKKTLLSSFKQNIGFEFTSDQKKVINEIFSDMQSEYPLNRLLQGDVGSGKTVVAVSAMLLAVENGYQAAIMAPTGVLAKQHFQTIKKLTQHLDIKIGFIAGSFTKKQREKFKEELRDKKYDIIVGTHALFSSDIDFANLKFIIIDEQHKFGVLERLMLREKAYNPDILVMTATPIPRTLAMSIYGDLDVSTIKTLPKGRKPIQTVIAREAEAMSFVISEVKKGRQGYIIYPAVDEDNKLELKSTEKMLKKLKATYFKNIGIGMLHGKMKAKEKDEIMQKFAQGDIKILIATTVVEVGVDVANASVMVIEHAERFGLSTLHQLRGRIGRAEHKSKCFLIPAKMNEKARVRLRAMVDHSDGFKLAEEDLNLRGPGEFLGKSQHGFLELSIGDITTDLEIIELAKKEASLFLENIKNFSKLEVEFLRKQIGLKFGSKIDFLKM